MTFGSNGIVVDVFSKVGIGVSLAVACGVSVSVGLGKLVAVGLGGTVIVAEGVGGRVIGTLATGMGSGEQAVSKIALAVKRRKNFITTLFIGL